MKTIEYKFNYNGTAMSFWKGENDTTIVFASGLPQYVSSYHPFVQTLSILGYNLLVPKYHGTWESDGVFDIHTSAESMRDALHLVHQGSAIELFSNSDIKIPNQNIILIGFSYGGLVTLLTDDSVNKKVLLVPFLNLELHGSKELGEELSFIQRAYPQVYKFDKEKFLSELSQVKYPDTVNDLTIVLGAKDKSITNEEIDWITKKYNPNIVTLDVSHTANLSEDQFKQILE